MVNVKNMVAKVAKMTAEQALKRDANRTSCNIVYQPKAPTALNRYKKV